MRRVALALLLAASLGASAMAQGQWTEEDHQAEAERVCGRYGHGPREARLNGCTARVQPLLDRINTTNGSLNDLTTICRNVLSPDWPRCVRLLDAGVYDRLRPSRRETYR